MVVLTMSHGELSRFDTLMRAESGGLRVEDAAVLLGLKRRQIHLHPVADRPVHDTPAMQIENEGKVELAFATPRSKLALARSAPVRLNAFFTDDYFDIDEWRDAPVCHHYIHDGFKGTKLTFSFHFSEKTAYQSRFFQYVAPILTPADTALRGTGENNRIAFAFESGCYLVESNMGGTMFSRELDVTAFQGSATPADYSRVVAKKQFEVATAVGSGNAVRQHDRIAELVRL